MISFSEAMKDLRSMCQHWTVVALCLLLPLNLIYSHFFSTLEFPYVWIISLAYKHEVLPAFLSLSLFTVMVIWVEMQFKIFRKKHFQHHSLSSKNTNEGGREKSELKQEDKEFKGLEDDEKDNEREHDSSTIMTGQRQGKIMSSIAFKS
jgi:hypothetical protein